MGTVQGHKSCVVIPGFFLGARRWKDVMFGNLDAGVHGRISVGLQTAAKIDADLVYWGGGHEAEVILERARSHEPTLVRYLGNSVRDYLYEKSFVGTSGVCTDTEMTGALLLCNERRLSQMIIASDRGHRLRCYKFATDRRCDHGFMHIAIDTVTSDVSCTQKEAIVYEGPTEYRDNLQEVATETLRLDKKLNGNTKGYKERLLALLRELNEDAESRSTQVLPPRLRAVK